MSNVYFITNKNGRVKDPLGIDFNVYEGFGWTVQNNGIFSKPSRKVEGAVSENSGGFLQQNSNESLSIIEKCSERYRSPSCTRINFVRSK